MNINNKIKERKTPEEIKEAIILELNNGPKGASEIAEKINSNWITTEKFLNELMIEKKVIEIISASKSKVYGSASDLSFFYLPLSEEIRKRTLSLLSTLNEIWKKETNTTPQKTILQKLAVEFVEKNNLQNEVPILRFHYGQTLALRFEEYRTTDVYPLKDGQKNEIRELITEYKGYSAKESKLKQYKKPSMVFYKIKEETINNFCLEKEEYLKKDLFNLFANYPSELSASFKLFDKLMYCAINILNIKDNKNEYLSNIRGAFFLVWDCLTTEAYFYDVEKAISPEKKDLFVQIKSNYLNSKITNVSEFIEEIENEINNLEPEEINASDNLSDFVHELFSE
ncbi:MAG: hypothetical protein AABX54_03850 [Nanoarchaeota archaeon]